MAVPPPPMVINVVLKKSAIVDAAQRVAKSLTAYHGGTILPHAGGVNNHLTVAELVEKELLHSWAKDRDKK